MMTKAVLLVLALCQTVYSTAESDALLDSFLAADGIVLPADELETRRGIFESSWLGREEDELLSVEAMYTIEELHHQNGAVMEPIVPGNEELQKRAESILTSVVAPSNLDPRSGVVPGTNEPMMNDAVNQETCGNCYLHTWVAALEIAYGKASGEKVKFSEQEMTDCYFKGCNGGDYRMVSVLMSFIDKLSTRAAYGDYLSKRFTCRQDTTPDSLEKIKVTGFVDVTTDTVEAAVTHYGSVMTCLKWGSASGETCRMDNYKKGQVVNYPEVKGGCDHAVLIVGYTPDHYIVRNSHGTTWGDKGYFLIKRNTNSCGIEETMASIAVEVRGSAKSTADNGCPADKPKLCGGIFTCTAQDEPCMSASLEQVVEEEVEMLEERASEELALDMMAPMLETRETEDETVAVEKRCADLNSKCPRLKRRLGCKHPSTARYCPKTCKRCGAKEVVVVAPKRTDKRGKCFRPTINNGVVKNAPVMKSSEKLVIVCNSGYTLVGDSVICLIQNVFTNKDLDGRLMPECIKLGDNSLVGNGATYTGSLNTYKDKLGRIKPCDNWKKDVLEGVLMNEKDGLKYQIGNHNYCRNPTGEDPVPMCLIFEGQFAIPVYCFKHPGCDTCKGAQNHPSYPDSYCAKKMQDGKCDYGEANTLATQEFYWANCHKTCCDAFC